MCDAVTGRTVALTASRVGESERAGGAGDWVGTYMCTTLACSLSASGKNMPPGGSVPRNGVARAEGRAGSARLECLRRAVVHLK
ncbi:FBP domain-containing protein [Rhodococcus xishaensis]|uniref:Elongation factor G-binding protein C-terminal treble-clef zinc-finger domain-containing protein n=1 Tax=Rhodococcus xishaensis TaxID=2487364 RepID=A0A3S3A9H5_9NOCA|nr:hypothetical protein EGT50_08820 [Rhodococcus xishaensis]